MIVTDVNVIAYAVLDSEFAELADAAYARDPEWLAPLLWRSELRNILATSMRVRGLALDQALAAYRQALELVSEPELEIDPEISLALARDTGASAYDCEYAFLAKALGVPLLSGDRRLVERFPGLAVSLKDFAAG